MPRCGSRMCDRRSALRYGCRRCWCCRMVRPSSRFDSANTTHTLGGARHVLSATRDTIRALRAWRQRRPRLVDVLGASGAASGVSRAWPAARPARRCALRSVHRHDGPAIPRGAERESVSTTVSPPVLLSRCWDDNTLARALLPHVRRPRPRCGRDRRCHARSTAATRQQLPPPRAAAARGPPRAGAGRALRQAARGRAPRAGRRRPRGAAPTAPPRAPHPAPRGRPRRRPPPARRQHLATPGRPGPAGRRSRGGRGDRRTGAARRTGPPLSRWC